MADKTMKNKFQKHAKIKPSVNGILGIISFSTRIPVKRIITLEEIASNVYIWPYVGLMIGVTGALTAYITGTVLNMPCLITSTLVYCFLIWFTGFNHIDGVMDLGDGLMVHGDCEKRLSIMRDSMVGTGGIATFFIIAALTITSLMSIPADKLVLSVILMELAAKTSMITTMEFGSSDTRGIAREVRKGIDYKVLIINIIITMIISYILLGQIGVIALSATIITGIYLSTVAEKNFGCITGDMLGASNEIGRTVCLLFIILNLSLPALL